MLTKNIDKTWESFFTLEKQKPYFKVLLQELEYEYEKYICYPSKDLIFNAFSRCGLAGLRVVIIGQDPYHGVGEANGLCFSVNDGITIPPSLKNIFTEINLEYKRVFFPTSGNLEHWANQGVLLLNASLTVRKDTANSHKHLKWNLFTDAVIQYISENNVDIVFMLWGNFAHKKGKKVDRNKHYVLEAGHPSPLSANRGFWFGNNNFVIANQYLKNKGFSEIEW
jgi:uracil-DNA glycosylase